MDKAKAALEERLEASGPSKKCMIDANGTNISKDRLVAEASPPPSDVRTAAEPHKICHVIVHTEEEEEALYDNAIVIDDTSEKSGDEAGSKASGPESAKDERTPLISNSKAHVLRTMPEGRIRKEGLGLSSYAVPLTRRTSNEVQLNIQRNSSETISEAWELNPDDKSQVETNRGKAAADYVRSRREQDGMSEIGPEEE
ncbi:hypothetical protein EDD22DRAFT_853999 [Suillus occidentalis]|nr:hypothetical protein EDD22DRAFT_853999 [Suillus occidentalis]